MKFLKSRNQTHAPNTHEDKSLLTYAEKKSKSLKITLFLYFLACFSIISAPIGIHELQKSPVNKNLEQERLFDDL